MSKITRVSVTLGALGILGAIGVSLQSHERPKGARVEPTAPGSTENAALLELRRELAATKLLAAAAAQKNVPDVVSAPNATAMKEVGPEPADVSFGTQQAAIEERFRGEAYDRTWSADARQRATKHLSTNLPPGSRLGVVECRQSLCRVEATHADLAAHQAFLRAAFMSPSLGWDGASMALLDEARSRDGIVLTIAYLAREGNDLPTGEEPSGL